MPSVVSLAPARGQANAALPPRLRRFAVCASTEHRVFPAGGVRPGRGSGDGFTTARICVAARAGAPAPCGRNPCEGGGDLPTGPSSGRQSKRKEKGAGFASPAPCQQQARTGATGPKTRRTGVGRIAEPHGLASPHCGASREECHIDQRHAAPHQERRPASTVSIGPRALGKLAACTLAEKPGTANPIHPTSSQGPLNRPQADGQRRHPAVLPEQLPNLRPSSSKEPL